MASLTLAIGPITASVNVADATATPVLLAFADYIGATGTNQQKADAVVLALARHISEVAQAQKRGEIERTARANAQAEINALKWGNGG